VGFPFGKQWLKDEFLGSLLLYGSVGELALSFVYPRFLFSLFFPCLSSQAKVPKKTP